MSWALVNPAALRTPKVRRERTIAEPTVRPITSIVTNPATPKIAKDIVLLIAR